VALRIAGAVEEKSLDHPAAGREDLILRVLAFCVLNSRRRSVNRVIKWLVSTTLRHWKRAP